MGEPEDTLPLLQGRRARPRARVRSRIREEVDGVIAPCTWSAIRCSWCSATDHPLAHKRNVRIADFADDAWIAGSADCECNRLINRACAVAGFEPRIAFETDEYRRSRGSWRPASACRWSPSSG